LRLLQEQVFERLGGNETVRTDVRMIAASHRDLKAWSAEGKFRPDLYFRLGVFTIHLPPLRERCEDLAMLAQHYVRRFSLELGRDISEVAPEALDRLREYSWPGNVRELQSILKQAILKAVGSVLLPAFLPADLPRETQGTDNRENAARVRRGATLSDLEREAIQDCLFQTGGNRQLTAERLGISTRTLLRKIKEYALKDPLRSPSASPDENSATE
jgi:DNA-binding NtrC family response regulator